MDLFAGPGGWDLAATALGMHVVGIEFESSAVATRRAVGYTTIAGDVLDYSAADFRQIWGLIASPPCQTFSQAGKGSGRRDLEAVLLAVKHIGRDEAYEHLIEHCDPRTKLVLAPLLWALAALPEWIALEQVPGVLPVWGAFADVLREHGYHVHTDVLSAEQYGVPQTRKRAILVAHKRRPVSLPAPTHRRYKKGIPQHEGDPSLRPWVSMAEALSWSDGVVGFPRKNDMKDGLDYRARDMRDVHEPAFALTEKARSWTMRTTQKSLKHSRRREDAVPYEREMSAPSPTVTGATLSGWTLRNNTSENAAVRAGEDPAPTMYFSQRLNGMTWSLNTGRDWKPGGTREDAQSIPNTQPAPTVTAKSGGQWQLRGTAMPNATVRRIDEPAHTMAFGHAADGCRWENTRRPTIVERRRPRPGLSMRSSISDAGTRKAPARPVGEPAATITTKHRSAEWVRERPATTVCGDARLWPPGHKVNAADRARLGTDAANARYGDRAGTQSVRIAVWEAAVLQSFPVDYPWQGSKTKQFGQVGNAIPPLLSLAVLGAVV